MLLSAIGDFGAVWTYAAITMAALPPALNIFVIATQYNVGVERASACVLIGTLASMVTLTGFSFDPLGRPALRSVSLRFSSGLSSAAACRCAEDPFAHHRPAQWADLAQAEKPRAAQEIGRQNAVRAGSG